MHVMTRYLDTRKATIDALCDYPTMERIAAGSTLDEIKELKDSMVSLPSQRLDGLPSVRDPHSGEARLAATLDKVDLLEAQRTQAREYLAWFTPAWDALSEDDRFTLNAFFFGYGSQEDRVGDIAEHFHVERDSVYRRKNRALDRLKIQLYGRM